MNQNQLAELFDTSKQNIGQYIQNILDDSELNEYSVVINYLTTAKNVKQYPAFVLRFGVTIGFKVPMERD
jgi:hypothetical protein